MSSFILQVLIVKLMIYVDLQQDWPFFYCIISCISFHNRQIHFSSTHEFRAGFLQFRSSSIVLAVQLEQNWITNRIIVFSCSIRRSNSIVIYQRRGSARTSPLCNMQRSRASRSCLIITNASTQSTHRYQYCEPEAVYKRTASDLSSKLLSCPEYICAAYMEKHVWVIYGCR